MKDPRRFLPLLRRLTLLLAFAGLIYLVQRYEMVTLPESSCSPLVRFSPGTRLLFDTAPPGYQVGDVVLYEVPGDRLGLGELLELRSPGASAWSIARDCPDCSPGWEEEQHWIDAARLNARLVLVNPF